MSAIDLAAVMDALAARLTAGNVTERVYPWPVESITVPCAVVGYPTDLDFDMTYKRGSDRAVFPLWVMVGKASDRTARDALSVLITGATGVKDAIDGPLGATGSVARVTNCSVTEVTVAAVPYLAARFDTEVMT